MCVGIKEREEDKESRENKEELCKENRE